MRPDAKGFVEAIRVKVGAGLLDREHLLARAVDRIQLEHAELVEAAPAPSQ